MENKNQHNPITTPFGDAKKIGNTIYVSGQIPKDPQTGNWAPDINGQTTTCLEKIKGILAKYGATLHDVIKTTVYLTNMDDYAKMNQAYVQFFVNNGVQENFPARSAVQVGPLMYPEWLIELDCVAILHE